MSGALKVVGNNHFLQDSDNLKHISKEQLVSNYKDAVYRFCISLVYMKQDADDLFQDTYLSALGKTDKINASENPLGFLLSIATSIWKSRKRKYARRNKIAPETELDETCYAAETGPEDEAISNEEILKVRQMVDDLPDKFKAAIVMYYTIDMDIREIAAVLGLPTGTVKSRLSRARGIIRKGLVEEYGND